MQPRYLLDTNIASYIIKGNVPAVRRRLAQAAMADVTISAITEAELRFGVARKPEAGRLREVVDEFLLRLTILPWGSEAAEQYGRLRASLERQGRPMGNFDLMIAAQAMASSLVLVTHDRGFKSIHGLKLEDWTKP